MVRCHGYWERMRQELRRSSDFNVYVTSHGWAIITRRLNMLLKGLLLLLLHVWRLHMVLL